VTRFKDYTWSEFLDLSCDIYDEAVRRSENEVPFLCWQESMYLKRNTTRQRLATLSLRRFNDLLSEVLFEMAQRYPNFKSIKPRVIPTDPKAVVEMQEDYELTISVLQNRLAVLEDGIAEQDAAREAGDELIGSLTRKVEELDSQLQALRETSLSTNLSPSAWEAISVLLSSLRPINCSAWDLAGST